MNWFKHKVNSHTDERLAEYLSENGLEGYGFWWLLMEVVAAQCVGEKCSATYTLPHWSRLLYSHHNKVGKYLGKLEVTGIVTVEYLEGKIEVTIPNLLKYRDEYSRKSGQYTDSVRSKNKKKNIDTDTDTEVKEDKAEKHPPPSSLVKLWNEIVKVPKVTSLTKSREHKCRVRLSERSIVDWESVMIKISNTPFLKGENDRGWRADFDWLIANDTIATKILEGKYDGNHRPASGSAQAGRKTGIIGANLAGTDFLS